MTTGCGKCTVNVCGGLELLPRASALDQNVFGSPSRMALALREIVLEEAPGAVESIFKTYAVGIAFSFTGKPLKDGFCHIAAYRGHVNLGFNRGAELPDPHRVLRGTGKSIRHVTIRNLEDADKQFIRRYLQAAIERAAKSGGGARDKARKR